MPTLRDIDWLAGLLEGEGSFCCNVTSSPNGVPIIQLHMTDRDVVEHAGRLLQANLQRPRPHPTQKTAYRVAVQGSRAISWMMTLWTLLGQRRRAQIEEVLKKWRR